MRLIIHNILSDDDKNTIIRGLKGSFDCSFDLKDIKNLNKSLSAHDKQFFDCLSWLIANKRIEILVIEPNTGNGISHTKPEHFMMAKNM